MYPALSSILYTLQSFQTSFIIFHSRRLLSTLFCENRQRNNLWFIWKMSIFKWTSPLFFIQNFLFESTNFCFSHRVSTGPIRQGGLSPIPNEIYTEIFNHLRPLDINPWIDSVYRRDFSRVALVCRFFCSVMLPWIFESMEFTGKNQNGSLNHTPFCRSIIRGCESARTVATFVKRCSFSDWIENEFPPSWYNTEFQILYSKALAFMPNVEELKLTKTSINKYMLKSILGLKCLTSLSLDLSPIQVGAVKAKDIRKLSTLRLKRLRFYENGPYDDGDNTSLISQAICLDSLLVVHTNHWPLVARIAEQNCNLPLQELDIFVAKDVGLLPKIFQKTPALEKLRISMAADLKHVQFGGVLPALDELCCPLFLLQSLVPKRPISSINTVTSYVSLMEITVSPSLFKKSTCKIRSLCVPIHDYMTIPFWEHFPDLKSLRLKYAPTAPTHFICAQKVFAKLLLHQVKF